LLRRDGLPRQARPTRIVLVSLRDGEADMRRVLENSVHGQLGGAAATYLGLRVVHDAQRLRRAEPVGLPDGPE